MVQDIKETNNKTIKYSIIISLAISIAVILVILYFTIDANTIETLRTTNIKYEFFALAVVLNLVNWTFWGARLKVIANELDEDINLTLVESIKIVITNMFLACITPSMAGGEPVRVYLLNKKGMNIGSATASVIGERLVDAIFVLILVPIAFLIFRRVSDLGFINTALLVGVFVFIMFLIIFLYAISKPQKIKKFLIWLSKKLKRFSKRKESESSVIKRINFEVDNFHKGIKLFKGKGKKSLLKAGFFTAISWSAGFMIPSMILMGLGLPPYFVESYAAQLLILVIIMMPTTPGSSGVAEGSLLVFYNLIIRELNTTDSRLGVFVLLHRFITFHLNLIAGAIFQYKVFKSVASFSLNKIKSYETNQEKQE